MQSLANRRDADVEHGQSVLRTGTRRGEELGLVVSIDVTDELLGTRSAIEKRLDDEIRWTKKRVGQPVLSLLSSQDGLVERVLMVGRQRDAKPLALLLHDFERKTSVRIRSFQNRRYPEPTRFLECG